VGSTRWSHLVARFARTALAGAYVGNDWKRRIVYEISRTPALIRRDGAAPIPTDPRRLSRAQLDALRRVLRWSPPTLTLHLIALRRFVKWAGNPLASEREAWAVSLPAPSRRRWLSPSELAELYRASRGLERLLISLEGFNGLRRVEVLRLRGMDVDVAGHRLRVLGKGRNGGKWRTVPLFTETEAVLRRYVGTSPGEAPLVPYSRSGADLLLRRAVRRSGLARRDTRVSHHDLRRTFGRLSYQAGMDLVQLKNLYGHASLDQTVHYIGLDEDRMRAGLDSLARSLRPLLAGGRPRKEPDLGRSKRAAKRIATPYAGFDAT
jgi:integrase